MKKQDPIEALESFYRQADQEAAPVITYRKTKPALILIKAACACAAGIVLAVLLTSTATPQLKAHQMPIAEADMRERFAKSGLNADDFIETPKMRSQNEGGRTWRA